MSENIEERAQSVLSKLFAIAQDRINYEKDKEKLQSRPKYHASTVSSTSDTYALMYESVVDLAKKACLEASDLKSVWQRLQNEFPGYQEITQQMLNTLNFYLPSALKIA